MCVCVCVCVCVETTYLLHIISLPSLSAFSPYLPLLPSSPPSLLLSSQLHAITTMCNGSLRNNMGHVLFKCLVDIHCMSHLICDQHYGLSPFLVLPHLPTHLLLPPFYLFRPLPSSPALLVLFPSTAPPPHSLPHLHCHLPRPTSWDLVA